jgi:hypothetical protein
MVNAISISKVLALIEATSAMEHTDEKLYISTNDLKQMQVSKNEAEEALYILANDKGYKCIEITDDKEDGDIVAPFNLLNNFNQTKHAFIAYINYVRNEKKAEEQFPNEDWKSLKNRFGSKDSNVYWGLGGITDGIKPLISRVKDYNCTLRLIGNDVVLEFNDGSYGVLKTLRTDQAPFFFLKYMIMHADQVITKTVIQTEIDMCRRKNDMTELVRQCGLGKELKQYFFAGTTKDKVVFTPYANIPFQTASESYI